MNEYWAQMLKMQQAQQAWDALVWKNMQACPWLFWPPAVPSEEVTK
jgi:hypothetical protein